MWRVEIKSVHYNDTEVYNPICQDRGKIYTGQNEWTLKAHFSEHVRYTKPNNSAYAMHMHNMSHSYRPIDSTTKLIEYSKYKWKMKVDENLHIHLHNNTVTCQIHPT
jgi:hypothetical protein